MGQTHLKPNIPKPCGLVNHSLSFSIICYPFQSFGYPTSLCLFLEKKQESEAEVWGEAGAKVVVEAHMVLMMETSRLSTSLCNYKLHKQSLRL